MKQYHHILLLCFMILLVNACEKDEDHQPIASFEADATEVVERQLITFTNSSENATAYYWEFGDGKTSTDFHTTHKYEAPGSYEVKLTVFSGDNSDKESIVITVEEDPTPIACFTVPSTNFSLEEEVVFTNCSEKADSYSWDFGDGNTSTEAEPVHVYNEPGEMDVVLSVENEYGEDSMSKTINILEVAFFDGFEDYEDFSLSFGDWTQIDNDGSPTWTFADYGFPNAGYVGSFIIFNPSDTDPPADEDERFTPYNGQKYAACFSAKDQPNDDWMISPEIYLEEGYELSLAIKSYTDEYGPDLFAIQLLDEDDVIWITPEYDPIQPPLDWTVYSYDLSEFAGKQVQVKIGCLSDDALVMFIDDITVKSADGKKVFHQDFESTYNWEITPKRK